MPASLRERIQSEPQQRTAEAELTAADCRSLMDARTELMSIIRDAWTIYDQTGDARDAELARIIEADARELLARLPVASRPKLRKSKKAKRRKAFKHCVRLDADAPRLLKVYGHVL